MKRSALVLMFPALLIVCALPGCGGEKYAYANIRWGMTPSEVRQALAEGGRTILSETEVPGQESFSGEEEYLLTAEHEFREMYAFKKDAAAQDWALCYIRVYAFIYDTLENSLPLEDALPKLMQALGSPNTNPGTVKSTNAFLLSQAEYAYPVKPAKKTEITTARTAGIFAFYDAHVIVDNVILHLVPAEDGAR